MPNIVALRLLARAMYVANHEIRAGKKQGIEPDFERAVQYLRSAVEAPDFIPALMRIEGILHEPEKKLDPYDVTPREDDIIVDGGGEWLDEELGWAGDKTIEIMTGMTRTKTKTGKVADSKRKVLFRRCTVHERSRPNKFLCR